MNETLRAESGHQVLRIKWRLAHPPEKVWRAITEPAELSQWYPATATKLEPRVGGAMVFDYGEGTISDAVVTEFDPPHVFAFRETPPEVMVRERASTIRFEPHPDGAGCLLLFTQFFHDRPAAASYATGWRCCLHVLETMLDGNPIPHPSIQVEEHQRFVAEFGLDAGSIEDTRDGWRVRFERQLMRQPGGAVSASQRWAPRPLSVSRSPSCLREWSPSSSRRPCWSTAGRAPAGCAGNWPPVQEARGSC